MKNFLKIFLLLLFFLLIISFFSFTKYFYVQHKNETFKEFCNKSLNDDLDEKDSCYCRMYNLLLPELLIYKVKIDNEFLKFLRFSPDSYIVPVQVMKKSDVIIGYGIWKEIEFEENFSKEFNIPSYAFDCGIENIKIKNSNCKFYNECIGTDNFILKEFGQKSSKKIHTFSEIVKRFNLENKKIYLKMDIAGAEAEVIPEILKYSDNITGISIAIHLENSKQITDRIKILKEIEKNFILVTRNSIRGEKRDSFKSDYYKGTLINCVRLTYVNKNLVDEYYLPINQNNLRLNKYDTLGYDLINDEYDKIEYSNISPIIVLAEKFKNYKQKVFKNE